MSRLPCPPQHIAQVPEADRDKCEPYTTLPALCRVRTCGLRATEEHHVVPKHFTRSWDERDYALLYGEIVPVKVPLCSAHHRDCTENRSWFEFEPGKGLVFWTELTEGEQTGLARAGRDSGTSPSPSVSSGHDESGLTGGEDVAASRPGAPALAGSETLVSGRDPDSPSVSSDESGLGAEESVEDGASPLSSAPSPGQSCPGCGRRVPYPKQPTSPKSKPVSYRVPADEIEEHKRILEGAAQHLGTFEQPHWQFWTYALALASVLGDPNLEGAAKR